MYVVKKFSQQKDHHGRRYGFTVGFMHTVLIALAALIGELSLSALSANATEPPKRRNPTVDVSLPSAPGFTGSLHGQVVFDGTPPVQKKLAVDKDHVALEGKELFDESLIVGKGGGVANVFVWLVNDSVPVSPVEQLPLPVTLRIKHLRYQPHAIAMTTSQKLLILNEDPVGACPIFMSQLNPATNLLVPSRTMTQHEFLRAERFPIPVAASVHPWLKAYLLIRDNPYFAVSDDHGEFKISNLPPGEWTFQFWHEAAGFLKRDTGWEKGRLAVTIGSGEHKLGKIIVTSKDFDLSQPAGPAAETPARESP